MVTTASKGSLKSQLISGAARRVTEEPHALKENTRGKCRLQSYLF